MKCIALGAALGCLVTLSACQRGDSAAEVQLFTVKRQKFSRIVEADGYLRPVQSTQVMLPAYLQGNFRIATLAADGSVVKKGELLVRLDDQELRKRKADAESDRVIAVAEKQKETIAQSADALQRQRAVESSARELAFRRTFQSKDADIFTRDQIIEDESNEKLQETKVIIAQKNKQQGQVLAHNKLGMSDVKQKSADEEIRRADRGLHALELLAAHDGVFTLRRDWNNQTLVVGDTVGRGQIVGMVARIERMEAEVFVLEAEASGLTEGRNSELIIDAQPEKPYRATIKRVDKVTKVRQSQSPTQYFGVTLSLDQTSPEVMKPEQRVHARLFLHEEEALVVPRPALYDRDSRWVVFRRDARGAFIAVVVKLGQSTAGLATIESGLSEGDVIALSEPGKSADSLLSEPAKKTSRAP